MLAFWPSAPFNTSWASYNRLLNLVGQSKTWFCSGCWLSSLAVFAASCNTQMGIAERKRLRLLASVE